MKCIKVSGCHECPYAVRRGNEQQLPYDGIATEWIYSCSKYPRLTGINKFRFNKTVHTDCRLDDFIQTKGD